jgi:hypothetical protein
VGEQAVLLAALEQQNKGGKPMKDSTRRMRAAASPHKRKHWHAEREAAATPAYTIEQKGEAWNVMHDGVRLATCNSNAEAWSWIDRQTISKRYGASQRRRSFLDAP